MDVLLLEELLLELVDVFVEDVELFVLDFELVVVTVLVFVDELDDVFVELVLVLLVLVLVLLPFQFPRSLSFRTVGSLYTFCLNAKVLYVSVKM